MYHAGAPEYAVSTMMTAFMEIEQFHQFIIDKVNKTKENKENGELSLRSLQVEYAALVQSFKTIPETFVSGVNFISFT